MGARPVRRPGLQPGDRIGDSERRQLLRTASLASVLTAAALVVIKALAVHTTGSAAVLGTLVDSGVDVIASVGNLIALRVALRPADEDHRFGHGRAEQLAALAQSALVAGSAFMLAARALGQLLEVRTVDSPAIGAAAMAVSIAATMALVAYQRHVVRRTGSEVIRADSMHYTGDLLMHGSVLSGLVLWSWLGWWWFDGLLALGIAGWLAYGAIGILRQAAQALMDHELPAAERKAITELALSHARVLGVHGLRTRLSGATRIVQLHLELDGQTRLADAHATGVQVADAIRRAFPRIEVLTHLDPNGLIE